MWNDSWERGWTHSVPEVQLCLCLHTFALSSREWGYNWCAIYLCRCKCSRGLTVCLRQPLCLKNWNACACRRQCFIQLSFHSVKFGLIWRSVMYICVPPEMFPSHEMWGYVIPQIPQCQHGSATSHGDFEKKSRIWSIIFLLACVAKTVREVKYVKRSILNLQVFHVR